MNDGDKQDADSPLTESAINRLTYLNLLIPGGGLILAGRVVAGLMVGILFVMAAALAIEGNLIAPHGTSRFGAMLTIGLAIGLYLSAQIRMRRAAREARSASSLERRRTTMIAARQAMASGEYPQARELLLQMQRENPADLHVAYRLAQIASKTEPPEAAREAWRRLRLLDKHRIYKEEIARQLETGAVPHPASR